MTATFSLNLPTDIPWERMCVSKDMLDNAVCDDSLPPKWNSSVAVFRYVPADEYQQFPNYKITYLKVSATITGYQPHDKEIQGQIDWDGISVQTIDDVEALLEEYHPCTGAILQVTLGPKAGVTAQPEDFPFFLDFEPKNRSLYEMATDTKEFASRSVESLNVGKSAGSLDSLEVLDIDQGSSSSFGLQGSYGGTGGGFTASQSSQGQWGTKSVGTRQSEVIRTQDQSQEKREGYSHSTQLSQLYHLLDAYHLGTNRAVFFIQPRPHVLEAPTGFVRGPRPVDGIQELFLVVAQPKTQDGFCLSVRLDTSHLTEIDVMDYAYKKDPVSLSASAPPPTSANDPRRQTAPGESISVYLFPGGPYLGEHLYDCFQITDTQSQTYISPWADYKIDVADHGGYTTTLDTRDHGSSSVVVSPDGEQLTITCTATSHHCVSDGGTICLDCPDTRSTWGASAVRHITVNLKSRQPIVKVGTRQVLIITTRGVCCCPGLTPSGLAAGTADVATTFEAETVRRITYVDALYARGVPASTGSAHPAEPVPENGDGPDPNAPPAPGMMTPRQANELSDLVRKELTHVAGTPRPPTPQSLVQTDFFIQKLQQRLQQRPGGRRVLAEDATPLLPDAAARALEKYYSRGRGQLKKVDLVRISNDELARVTKLPPDQIAKIRLTAAGVPFKGTTPPKPKAAASRSTRSRSTRRRPSSSSS